ncbi:MAG: thymidine phosphorylase, partial [Candidatus Eisenbacteria bacterium]|nr:thymidine phosphorylase [Candidatus Eisenbacteria bacterium]
VSKKIAEGAGALVYDVKCGSGAFMKSRETARSLATRLVATTRSLGRRARALVTDMSQPLGAACGNALEVAESLETLRGGGPADVRALTLELAAAMLVESGASASLGAARDDAERCLDSGAALERFMALVEAQGGDARGLESGRALARAAIVEVVPAPRSGVVRSVDTFGLGELLVQLGAGRRAKEDAIDPAVGVVVRARIGDRFSAGAPLAELHQSRPDPDVAGRVAACFELGDEALAAPELVLERIG